MLTGVGAFVATTTGKILLGTAIAAASVGGAHVAEVIDVPGFPDYAKTPTLVSVDESAPEIQDVVAHVVEPTAAIHEDVTDAEDDAADDGSNHGEEVSDFATTTDLEGCERGQAIAEIASSNADEHRQNPDSDDGCDEADPDEDGEDDKDDKDDKDDNGGGGSDHRDRPDKSDHRDDD